MAEDRTADDWHLTPEGWVQGTSRVFDSETKRPIPDNRVLTVTEHSKQQSSWSQTEEWMKTPFQKNGPELKRLTFLFGARPGAVEVEQASGDVDSSTRVSVRCVECGDEAERLLPDVDRPAPCRKTVDYIRNKECGGVVEITATHSPVPDNG